MKLSALTIIVLCSAAFNINNVFAQEPTLSPSDSIQLSWVEALNSNHQMLKQFYSANSGLMYKDTLYTEIDQILESLTALSIGMGAVSYETIETFQLRKTQKFEFGRYITIDGSAHYTIIGWRDDGRWNKEFEVIYPAKFNIKDETTLVDFPRDQWQKYSNEHRPDLIVEKVFSDNSNYFNRGMHSRGMEIADAYSYMKADSYSIRLEPVAVHQINEHAIFEIGIFHVGGRGLYTLIWKKEGEEWKLLMDFNF